jgi:hypothetical protein
MSELPDIVHYYVVPIGSRSEHDLNNVNCPPYYLTSPPTREQIYVNGGLTDAYRLAVQDFRTLQKISNPRQFLFIKMVNGRAGIVINMN